MFTLYALDAFNMKNVIQLQGGKGYVKFVERTYKLNENQYITQYPKDNRKWKDDKTCYISNIPQNHRL